MDQPVASNQQKQTLNSEQLTPSDGLPLSVYMITYNNGVTIERALQSVADWADEVIVVDSYSTDGALSLIHISEPTRLLSISYAVFCLKKKKQIYIIRCKHILQ